MADELEKDIRPKIRNELEKHDNIKFVPYNPLMGEKGMPDLIGVMKIKVTPGMVGTNIGIFLGIEIKRPGKKPSKIQDHRLTEIANKGGMVEVVRSRQDVRGFIDHINTLFEQGEHQ